MAAATTATNLDAHAPPYSEVLERAILAFALVEPSNCARVRALGVNREAFYVESHAVLWDAIHAAMMDGSADMVAVKVELEARGAWERIGGASYLDQILDTMPDSPVDLPGRVADLLNLQRLREADRRIALVRAAIHSGDSRCETVASALHAASVDVLGRPAEPGFYICSGLLSFRTCYRKSHYP